MGIKFMRAGDADVQHHIMVWGDSGTGKTNTLVRAAADLDVSFADVAYGKVTPVGDPTVFLLACERNALATARVINPQCGYQLCESKDASWEVLQAAKSGELLAAGFTRLAIDGFTELQRQIADHLDRDHDGFYGELATRTTTLLRLIRSIPMRITVTALEQQRLDERTKVVHVYPDFEMKKVPGQAMSMVAAVGRTTKVGEGDAQRYAVDFNLASRYRVKDVGPLRGRVKPCAAAWIEVLEGRMSPEAIRFAGPAVAPESELNAEAPAAEAGTAPVAVKIAR